jgi:hypothetical protein
MLPRSFRRSSLKRFYRSRWCSFSVLAVGSETIHAGLNSTGRKLLKDDHGKLTTTATATYSVGTTSNRATAMLTLHAAKKPKKK